MGHGPNYTSGIITEKIKEGGAVEKLVVPINLKAFYNDLHDTFVKYKFKDMLIDPDKESKNGYHYFDNQALAGEFVDAKANFNRTGDMYEQKFYLMKKEGVTEIEFVWKAKKKSSLTKHGWFEIKIDLTCRNMKDIEILDGNNKKILQSGGWEFRNEVVYKNSMIKEYLHKIPFVKNSQKLQELYFNSFYKNKFEEDLHYGEHKILGIIYMVMDRHFKTHFSHH